MEITSLKGDSKLQIQEVACRWSRLQAERETVNKQRSKIEDDLDKSRKVNLQVGQDEVDLFEIERQLDTRMKEVIEKQQVIDIDEIK